MPGKLAGEDWQPGLSDLQPCDLGQNVITNPACLEGRYLKEWAGHPKALST